MTLVARETNRVVIDADMRCKGMVIASEAYFPGWKATVDGALCLLDGDRATGAAESWSDSSRAILLSTPTNISVVCGARSRPALPLRRLNRF